MQLSKENLPLATVSVIFLCFHSVSSSVIVMVGWVGGCVCVCVCVCVCAFWGYDYVSVLGRHCDLCLGGVAFTDVDVAFTLPSDAKIILAGISVPRPGIELFCCCCFPLFPSPNCRGVSLMPSNLKPRILLFFPVMINFMCQLVWAIGCPDIWSDIILGVSMRLFFWVRLTIELAEWVKQVVLPNVSDPYSISRRPEENKKADPSASKKELLLPKCLSWDISLFLPLDSS